MFEINGYVICRNKGVCQITEIGQYHLQEQNKDTLCYFLRQYLNPQDVFCEPVDNSSIIRRIVTKNEAAEILDRIPYLRTINAPKEKIRNEFYAEAIDTYDCLEWIKVIKSVYIRQKAGRLSDTEVAFAAAAKEYFEGEISAALTIPLQDVENYIVRYVKNSI